MVDGATPENLVGVDVAAGFFELGYQLFNDAGRTPALTFVLADVTEVSERAKLPRSQFDVVYAGSLLHLLDEAGVEKMVKAAFALVANGGIFGGRNVGRLTTPGSFARRGGNAFGEMNQLRYLHTAESLRQVLLAAGFSSAEVVVGSSDIGGNSNHAEREMCFLSFYAVR